MSVFEEFDEYLSEEVSLGFWSEMGVDIAARIILEFAAEDWSALKSRWHERPKEWVKRCIEVLEYADSQQSIPLLMEILIHHDDDISQKAADTLETNSLRAVSIEANLQVKSRLEKLIQNRPQIDAETDQALLSRIQFPPA